MHVLYRLSSFLLVAVFVVVILTPLLITTFGKGAEFSVAENRNLASLPALDRAAGEIKSIPKLIDQYYADHFGLRAWFTKFYKRAKYSIGDSTSLIYTIGKDGWLFLGSIRGDIAGYQDPMGDARNATLYSPKELKEVGDYLTALKQWLNDQNIEYVLVIAPNKHTIYSEYLPDYIDKVNDRSAADQLVGYLKAYTNVSVVDLRGPLLREKGEQLLYYKTGTHWNFRGANIAQYEIMKVIEGMFPTRISPELYGDSIFRLEVSTDVGLEHMAGIKVEPPHYSPYPDFEGDGKVVKEGKRWNFDRGSLPTNVNHGQELNAVILRDSFFVALEPYFNRKFKSSTQITAQSSHAVLMGVIREKKPDIIIEEWAERILPYVPIDDINFPDL